MHAATRPYSVAWISHELAEHVTGVQIPVGPLATANMMRENFFVCFMAVILQRRVDFPMVDIANIVYYPEYWDLAHRFFEESWVKICGIDYPTLTCEKKLGFPAVHNECNFHAPLVYGDIITCKLWISNVGNKSCKWQYQYYNQRKELVWSASVVTVCANMDNMNTLQIPVWLAEKLENCKEDN